MRYTSALVLCTLAVGQAAALSNKHASFHARRQQEVKRADYDVSNVDWNKALENVNWDTVFSKTPAATPAASTSPVVAAAQAQVTSAAAVTTPAAVSSAPAPKSSSDDSDSGDAVDDFIYKGLEAAASRLGLLLGYNNETETDTAWIDKKGTAKYKATFVNDKSDSALLYCWASGKYTGMFVKGNKAAISVMIPQGEKVTIGIAEGVPGACAPVYSNTQLHYSGQILNTWLEYTFKSQGTFDVSRNVYMKGDNISAKGSKCTSDMETCVFKCKNGADSCEKGSDYDLFGCNASNGGGSGYDTTAAGTGGGCNINSSGEHLTVHLS